MATITLAVGANTKSWTISAAGVTRILDAVRTEVGPVRNEDGTTRPLTTAEVFAIIASRFETNLRETVRNAEKSTAVIPDLDLT